MAGPNKPPKVIHSSVLEAEATGENITFEFRDLTLSAPTGENMDVDTLKAFEDGKLVTFLELSLGSKQWAQVRSAGLTKVKDLQELVVALTKAMGTTPGE